MSATENPTDRDRDLDAAIAAYYQAVEAGRPPERDAFLAEYPGMRAELESFLADKAAFERRVATADPDATLPPAGAVADASDPPLGVVRYFGDYELIAEIARGGMGVVYRARQVSLNRIVALKMILTGQLASPADVQRFRTEAEAAANLDHPNILPVYEVGEHEGQQYFSMKLVDGGSLADLMAEYVGRPHVSAALVATVARAVHHAHLRGVLHRDLKPANILLDANGTPYVTDFGLAKRVEGDSGLTAPGAILGTPSYMAPEQARAEKQLTTAADVYALGAILYECLAGRPPFVGTTPLDTVLQVLEKEAPRPANVDRDLATVAMKCLEKEAGKRYESAAALADDLDHWQRGEPIAARPTTAGERAWRWCRRNPALAGMAAALLLALVAGTVVTALFARETTRAATAARQLEIDAAAARADAEVLSVQAAADAKQAKAAREESERRLRGEAARSLYANRITLAQQYWSADNLKQADRILDQCPAEFRGWEWRYLHRLNHTDLFTLPGNGQFVSSLHFSRDGKRMAAVSNNGLSGADVWDMTARPPKLLARLRSFSAKPKASFTAGTLSPDGTTLALGEHDGGVSLWDAASGKHLRDLGRTAGQVRRLSFRPDGTRLAALDGSELKVWDPATGREEWARKEINTAAFLPDNKHLLVAKRAFLLLIGSRDTVLQLCDADSGAVARDLGRQSGADWGATPTLLAVRSRSDDGAGTLRLIELASGKLLFTARLAGGWGDVAVHPNGSLIACCDQFGTDVQIWDVKTQRLARTLHGHTSWVNAVEFSPDGRLASCSWDNTVKIWDPTADQEFTRLPGQAAIAVSAAAFSSDSTRLAVVQGDNVATPLPMLFGNPGAVVTVWDPIAGKAVHTLKGHSTGARRVSFSADGRRLVSGGRDGMLIVWDPAAGKAVAEWHGHDGWVESVALSRDGRLLASAHEPKEVTAARLGRESYRKVPGEVKVWDATTGRLRQTLSGHPSTVYAVAVSPDGRLIASASYECIKLWDAATGREQSEFKGHQAGAVSGLSFSPDSRALAAASPDGVTLFDVATGSVRCTLVGGDRLAFDRDGRRVATAGRRVVKVWDPATGQELITLPLPSARVSKVDALAFAPDGNRLLALFNDGTNVAWDAPPPK